MELLLFLIALSRVPVVVSLQEVSGYIGGTVILPSGADPSWNLSRIDWALSSNKTFIATYRSQITNIDRFPAFKGRLTLNQISGDMTIHNLRQEDETNYTVYLYNIKKENKVNDIRLKVKQHLQKPTIKQIHNAATENGCLMLLFCSSQDQDVDFSWKVTPHNLNNWVNTKGGPSQLFVHVNTQGSVEFACTSSRKMENTSKVFSSKCNVAGKEPSCRNRWGAGVSCFFVVGLAVFLAFLSYYLTEKLYPPEN
ncbi:CD48 antigen [Austrofundulus limnaeus]|uniref:CD48 antigen n=1 Tax=Austrofundulus limnaeus TaxID=52670 RepID=A0A2I4BY61_AUSLI|nr:PREDICTED: CD48 antigen-like [Austrofundulus limnaeus]